MELKPVKGFTLAPIDELLIVPYGIETDAGNG